MLAVVAVLALLLAASACLYHWLASRYERHRFPPPGELIDVGGYRMHFTLSVRVAPPFCSTRRSRAHR